MKNPVYAKHFVAGWMVDGFALHEHDASFIKISLENAGSYFCGHPRAGKIV
jgi:hypothetical protein